MLKCQCSLGHDMERPKLPAHPLISNPPLTNTAALTAVSSSPPSLPDPRLLSFNVPNTLVAESSGEGTNNEPPQQQELDPLAEYQEELQNVLEYVDQGMILKSFGLLGQLTEKVVTNIEPLGLASDTSPPARHEGFWTGLNNCWLFALSHAQDTARWDDPPSSSALGSLIQEQRHLVHLKNRVVDWANRLEPWGLVDYELGFWERDILEAIETCLAANSTSSSSPSPSESSSPAPSPSTPSISVFQHQLL